MEHTQQEPIEGEEWRPAPGFEGSHSVSSLGRIRDEPRRGYYRVGSSNVRDGYRRVALSVDGSARMVSIHVLVALAFIGPRGSSVIEHIDDDPSNARLDNLRYVTWSHSISRSAAKRRANTAAG